MMKNNFNRTRFAMVLKKDAGDLRTPFLKAVLILCGIWAAAFIFIRFIFPPITVAQFDGFRSVLVLLLVAGSLILSSFQLYKNYNHRSKGIGYFMLPASQLEKFLSMFFYCVVVTPVVALVTFALFDVCLYPLYPWEGVGLWISRPTVSIGVSAWDTVSTVLAVQSVFFFCNIHFQRAKIQKTALAIAVLLVFFICFSKLLHLVFPTDLAALSQIGDNLPAIISLETFGQTIWGAIRSYLLFLIFPIGLWIISYKKMKEQAI